jgi:hypothetical protein
MDGLVLLFGVLTLLFVGLVIAMNVVNVTASTDGFEDAGAGAGATAATAAPLATLPPKIRAVLDPMTASGDDLCALYDILRQTGIKNAKAGPGDPPSDAEAARKVEADFALKIPGGALPCPLLTYPKEGATDLDWLAFLQTIPKDFGARIVFMALYARDTLKEQLTTIKHSLGEGFRSLNVAYTSEGFRSLNVAYTSEGFRSLNVAYIGIADEGFQAICTPEAAASRKANALTASCTLPEDLSPQQIDQAATDLLKSLVVGKMNALNAKKIDPTLDIAPIIKEAKGYAAQLKVYSDKAQSGTLDPSKINVGSS